MSRFNTPSPGTKTTNLAGGQAFTQNAELELISLMVTSFVDDSFYRSGNQTLVRLKQLLATVDPEFAAKATVFARTKFGMRSISHVAAAELTKRVSGKPWAKSFYKSVVYRADDVTEILSYYFNHVAGKSTKSKRNRQMVPSAMKKGLAAALEAMSPYALAKYRGDGKSIKLVDAVNLLHPKYTDAITALVKGELKSVAENETWETALTQAGQQGKTAAEKAELKRQAWNRLLDNNQLKYFAALRNLRNVIEQAPDALPKLLNVLTDEKQIKRSLVLPFRFATAYEEMQKLSNKESRSALVALNKAIDIACNNVPKFEGETCVVLDVSSSMRSVKSGKTTCNKIGALFTAVLAKALNCDVITFDGDARYVNLNPSDSTLTLAQNIPFNGGSTSFNAIFRRANKGYDRMIILSDMQGWLDSRGWSNGTPPTKDYAAYCAKYNCHTKVYSFDLGGLGTLQFPERNVFCLAGFSEKTLDIMGMLEGDRQAFVNEVKKIQLGSAPVAEEEVAG